ncbi:uncharacterized protein RHO25_003139 [Cercospora beticola]|nr:hypothetical protein RHO25_003139 [Cercospora beticola]
MDRRLRYFYFGPVTNSAVLLSQDELDIECPSTDGPDGRRARALIRSVSHETHDYLMTLYWSSFNQVLPVINRKAYEDDFTSRSVGYYSNLLHLCQLAMGFRFSDKTRQDMKALARGSFESIFHQEAKYMIDTEIEQPRGLPTISALLLMGDLECGVGRDNVGWMMHAMAIRIALDLRLNLAPSHCETQLNQEAWLGRQTLWACTVYDCYWALFGQRPTTIKVEEIEVDLCTPNQDGADAFDPSKGEAFSAGRVYGALLELMSIAGRIYSDPETLRTPRISELHKTSLKRELQCWYAQLDGSLTLTPENIREASPDMFLLHQQYHSMLILLHWPLVESPGVGGITNYFDMTQQRQREVMNALHICRKSAVAVTRIYQEYMKRFDPTKLFITCVQHIVTAASALIASCQIGGVSSDTCIQQLRILSTVITAAATTYKPAGIIRTLLEEALTELSLDLPYRLGSSSSAPLDTLVNLNGDTFEWNLAHFVNDTCTEPEESWVSCLLHNSGRAEQFAYS